MAAPTVPRTPNVHRAYESLTESADGRVTTALARHGSGEKQIGKGSMPMFSFARSALLWLAATAVKAQDELAALGLDSRLASQKNNCYPGKAKHQI